MDTIHMIGYDAVHPSDFIYDVQKNSGTYLLILTHTPLRFWGPGGERIYPAHHAVLFSPDARIRYGACEESYANDWIIFSSDESYIVQFPLQNVPFPVLDSDYCHNLFQLLTWEHLQGNYEAVVSQLMMLLFQKLRANIDQRGGADYLRELTALRRRILTQPRLDWSVAAMASQLHISAGYLHQLYKRRFGVSCMEDVIASRIRLAKDYLAHTQLRILEIAALCGYNNAEHFSRQFRQLCGVSPGEYRRSTARVIDEPLP